MMRQMCFMEWGTNNGTLQTCKYGFGGILQTQTQQNWASFPTWMLILSQSAFTTLSQSKEMGLLRQNEKRIFSDHVSYIFGISCNYSPLFERGTYHVGWSSFIVLTQFCLVTIGPKSTMNSIFERVFYPMMCPVLDFFASLPFLYFFCLFSLQI